MWIPEFFQLGPDQALRSLRRIEAADLITPTVDGLQVTYLPWLFDETVGEQGALLGHIARANPHASCAPTGPSLVIVHGADAYVSPRWYSGVTDRVVPTWDYEVIHAHGDLVVHDDPSWVRDQVERLSDHFEAGIEPPWRITEAPDFYINGMCRAIVGIELRITRIEAKAKLSQNKPPEDVAGVVSGLRARGDHAGADAVETANAGKMWPPLRRKYLQAEQGSEGASGR